MAARIGHILLCPIRIMIMKKIEYDNIPEWAIYALEYGISEDMSLDDEPVSYTHLTLPTICSV